MPLEHAYEVTFTDPGTPFVECDYDGEPGEFSFPGTSTVVVKATTPEQAEIKANVWYYGETVPTITPKHEVRIVLL